MTTISFIVPDNFNNTHFNKLSKSFNTKYRFWAGKVNMNGKIPNQIDISFDNSMEVNKRKESIFDYVNGFFAAIE